MSYQKKLDTDVAVTKGTEDTFKDICKQITARECMQGATARSEEMTMLPLPPRIRGEPPDKPNGYTDGSYVNSAGNFWGLGG